MAEKSKNVFIGVISGAGTGVFMEVLRAQGYLASASVVAKALLAGVMALAIYMLILLALRLAGPGGTQKN